MFQRLNKLSGFIGAVSRLFQRPFKSHGRAIEPTVLHKKTFLTSSNWCLSPLNIIADEQQLARCKPEPTQSVVVTFVSY